MFRQWSISDYVEPFSEMISMVIKHTLDDPAMVTIFNATTFSKVNLIQMVSQIHFQFIHQQVQLLPTIQIHAFQIIPR
jgi:hypothetical protein